MNGPMKVQTFTSSISLSEYRLMPVSGFKEGAMIFYTPGHIVSTYALILTLFSSLVSNNNAQVWHEALHVSFSVSF